MACRLHMVHHPCVHACSLRIPKSVPCGLIPPEKREGKRGRRCTPRCRRQPVATLRCMRRSHSWMPFVAGAHGSVPLPSKNCSGGLREAADIR